MDHGAGISQILTINCRYKSAITALIIKNGGLVVNKS